MSHIILIGDEPVIGTLGCDLVERSFFAFERNQILKAWRQRMHARIWNWLPRFYGYYGNDRNPDLEYEERRDADGRTEVYVPDGWLVGQTALRA